MKNRKENIDRKEYFSQVCVWPGTIVGEEHIEEFEKFMFNEFKSRIQYLEEIKTKPDIGDPNTGGRNDVFFAVHDEDVGKFAVPRLIAGIRWIEDVLDNQTAKNRIYPSRVKQYRTW